MKSKGEGRLRGFGVRGVAKALLISAVAIFLAWQVVRASAVEGLLRQRPNAAARVSPGDPRAKMAVAMNEFRRRNGTISRTNSTRAINALARAPLAEEPFLLAGLSARINGDVARGERLLAEARHRNPRSRTARLILLDRYLRSNQVAAAAGEIKVLTALVPQTSTVLIPELARMVRNPGTRPAMLGVLRQDGNMQSAVLEQLATAGSDPDLILAVAGGAKRDPAAAPAWQGLLIDNLVKKGDVLRARRLWNRFAGSDAGGEEPLLYDGRFQGLPGVAPFNWKLASGSGGVAERTKKPALEVAYYGRMPVELASQLLMLRPGRYRLQFRAEGDATGEGSRLAWTVTCHPRKVSLLDLTLRKIDYAPRLVAGDFTIPASGCPSQWLTLSGIPGEFPNAQNMTISDMQIRKAGAS